MIVKIERRLQDFPRFVMLPADEAFLLGLPILMGLLGRMAIPGIVAGVVLWALWKRLKGDEGLQGLLAAVYWFAPAELGLFKGLPDASVSQWEA